MRKHDFDAMVADLPSPFLFSPAAIAFTQGQTLFRVVEKHIFFVIPGARLSRTPSLFAPLKHLCDLEAGYRGDRLQSWWDGTGI